METGQQGWEEGFDKVEGTGFGARLEQNSLEVDALRDGYHARIDGVMGA